MKKNFLKISLAFCFLAMLGVSSFNLNASGGGGGGGEDPETSYKMERAECPVVGYYNRCWTICTVDPSNVPACRCDVAAQTVCQY